MRTVILVAALLAWSALPAAAEPSLTFSVSQIFHGEIVHIRGTGFTPKGNLLAHLIRPDGTEYPETPFIADAKGELTHEITIVPNTFGTYELLVEDLATGLAASQRFLMVPLTFAKAVKSQTDRLPQQFASVWQGPVSSPRASSSQPSSSRVIVSLSGGRIGAVVGTIAYPSQLCGGEVWLVSVTPEAVQLGERITYGEERCTGRAIVTLRAPKGENLSYEWRDIIENSTAQGALLRRD